MDCLCKHSTIDHRISAACAFSSEIERLAIMEIIDFIGWHAQ
jgi:hypothetical protein